MDLGRLRYARLAPDSGRPSVVEAGGVLAAGLPPETARPDRWVRCDFRRAEDARNPAHRPGWKAHVSVDGPDVGKAWDLLLPLVAAEKMMVKAAGAALVDRFSDPDHEQAGKTVVLYADGCRAARYPSFWEGFLRAAEERLRAAGVRPGLAVRGDRPVAGSAFFHVRCDKGVDGRYASGLEAYDPLGFAGPFDGVRIASALPAAAAVGDVNERVARMLDFVAPGWEAIEDGVTWMAGDEPEAVMTERALACVGLRPLRKGDALVLPDVDAARVAAGWHEAMEIRRAAEIGGIVREASGLDGVHVGVRARRASNMPPVVRIRFGEAGHAPVALRGLGALSRAGFATPRLEDGDLVVPYAGFLHAGEAATRENLAGLSADLNLAFGRGPAGEPRRSEAEADEEAAAAPSA